MSAAPGILVAGTASAAGKSVVVAGLCRAIARRGVKVAPVQAQITVARLPRVSNATLADALEEHVDLDLLIENTCLGRPS